MKISKLLLSIFIIFHVGLMLMIPFQSTILRERLFASFYSYVGVIGLNTAWNFFSPDPAPKTFFEIETYDDKKNSEGEWEFYNWPPKRSEFFFRETFYRRLFSSKALFIKEERWPVLAKYFCKEKKASLVTLRLVSYPAGSLIERVQKDKKTYGEKQFLCEDLMFKY